MRRILRARRPAPRPAWSGLVSVALAVGAVAALGVRSPLADGDAGWAAMGGVGGGGVCVAPVVPRGVALPAPPPVAREFRGAWVSPVENGEWPSRPGMSVEAQRAELLALLDRARDVGLNAVVLHVRPAADALYPTAQAPWSAYLVGRGGARDAGWDPLATAIGEAHARGLQLHVWFNPFRATSPDGLGSGGAAFVAREHPEWLVQYGRQSWIDPGIPAARQAVLDAILEVVDRYDIDGVHLDDYFYPYREERTVRRTVKRGRRRRTVVTHEPVTFDDGASWARYGRAAGFDDRDAWRRANVNAFIEQLYKRVKARRSSVLVGISPFGIWRPGSPPGVTGLDSFAETYADSRLWLRQGWLDYLAPQLYWRLDGEQRRFTRLDAWWRTVNPQGRHLWPGLLTMRASGGSAPWGSAEIAAEIAALRTARGGTAESVGHLHFRMGSLTSGALGDQLARGAYADFALPPASPWLGADVPNAPRIGVCRAPGDTAAVASLPESFAPSLGTAADSAIVAVLSAWQTSEAGGPATTLHVEPDGGVAARWWLVQLRDASGRWWVRTWPGTMRDVPLTIPGGAGAAYAAVSAVSPTQVVGPPTVVPLATNSNQADGGTP